VQTALDGSRRGGFGMRDGDTRVHSTEIKKDLANVCPPAWHMMWYIILSCSCNATHETT